MTSLSGAAGDVSEFAPTPLRALVLEDSDDDALLVARALRAGGYDVESQRVETAAEFERALDGREWDAVIADFSVPGYGWPAALDAFKRRGLEIPFILVAGAIDAETAVQAIKAGAHDYVLKQNLARLAPAIERELRKTSGRRARKRPGKLIALQGAALSAAENAIFITDPEGRIEWANDSFARVTGFTNEDAIGENPRILASGQHGPALYGDLCATIRAGEIWRGELTDRHRNGSLVNVKETITPITDGNGTIEHFLAIQEDVTAERQATEALAEWTAELQRSNLELEEFAYIASHDLAAPLRAVSGYLDLIVRRWGADLDPDAGRFIERAFAASVRMQTMIDDLLAYSRASQRPLVLKPVDAGEAAREALEQLGAAADETGARIELGELPILSADRSQVVLLFQHLVSNALKFHGDAPPRIAVTATRSVSDWRLDVRDGGTGIDPERVDELFKMFHRLDGEHYEGSGIGLAVCKRIVERHGGRIWYEPAPDGGSVFSFTIPDAAP